MSSKRKAGYDVLSTTEKVSLPSDEQYAYPTSGIRCLYYPVAKLCGCFAKALHRLGSVAEYASCEPRKIESAAEESSVVDELRRRIQVLEANHDEKATQRMTLLDRKKMQRAQRYAADGGEQNAVAVELKLPIAVACSRIDDFEDELRVLTFNLWYEPHEQERRMVAIDQILQEHRPHIIALQEVTPQLWELCANLPGFSKYNWKGHMTKPHYMVNEKEWKIAPLFTLMGACVPFSHVRTLFKDQCGKHNPRDLLFATMQLGDRKLVVGTSHLDSLAEDGTKTSKSIAREGQVHEACKLLDQTAEREGADAIWLGDTNWVTEQDGKMVLNRPWLDAWSTLRPGEDGATYDLVTNSMARERSTGKAYGVTADRRDRCDRIWVSLNCLEMDRVELIGTQPLDHKDENGEAIFPSDHYGVALTMKPLK